MNSKQIVEELQSYKGINVFNPYTDNCEVFDKQDAQSIRSENLSKILNAALEQGVDTMWIGRDLGHRGGRRTGLALTDEAHLQDAGDRWGVDLSQATRGRPLGERTARNIWDFVNTLEQRVFMWNVFPFHPHEENKPFTNRNHTAKERDAGIALLEIMTGLLRPKRMAAIGNDAFKVSVKLFPGIETFKIRHPSYGGEKEFFDQLSIVYSKSINAEDCNPKIQTRLEI